MRDALELARTGLGEAWPNPTVGCVLVRDGEVVGRGRTAAGGRPHAEVVALEAAGGRAEGATAYITLEPCSHWGRTPPCTDALVDAEVSRVLVAVKDPDPRVNGRGIEQLRQAGIDVNCGILEAEAAAVNRGFFHRIFRGRPLITPVPREADLRRYDGLLASCAGGEASARLVVMFGAVAGPARYRVLFAGEVARPDASTEMILVEQPPGSRAALGRAFAELGERGLTHLAIRQGDPLVAALTRATMLEADDGDGEGE